MKESFIAAVLRYYSTYLRYLWPAVILTVGLGIILYFWRSRERRIESFHRYVRDDVMLMAWTVVFGAVFFGLDRGRVWISVLLMIACILLILLAVFRHTVDWRFSIHVVFMLLIVARLWGGAFWDPFTDVVYIALSVLSVAAWAGTVSDLLLFLDRRRLYLSAGKPPEQTAVDQMECRHLGVTALMTILVMAVLILPSDLNFVYLSGHVYDDPIVIAAEAFKARKTTQRGTDPAASEGTDAASHVTVSDRFLFERSEMLDLLQDYIWPFDTSPIHGRNGDLNMHTIEMRLLEDRSFDNVLLEDICALTRGNKINPSLLFVNSSMLGYGNDKSRTFPIDPVTLETAPAPLPQRAESSDTVSYMRRCFAVLLHGKLLVGQVFGSRLLRLVVLNEVGQRVVAYLEGERCELLVTDVHGLHLAHLLIVYLLGDLQDGLSLVVQLRADMTSRVVVGLVQVKDGMDVQVVKA